MNKLVVTRILEKQKKSISSFLQIVVLYHIFFGLLCLTYIDFIVPVFGTEWLYVLVDVRKIVISALLIMFLSILLAFRTDGAKSLFLHLQFSFPVLPMIVIYAVGGGHETYLFMTILSYLIVYIIGSVPAYKRGQSRGMFYFAECLSISGLMWLCLIFSIFFILAHLVQGDRALINFNPDKVYDFRRQATASVSALMGYMSTNIIALILPMGTASALYRRKYFFVFLFFLISVLIFGITSHKVPLLIVPTILLIYWALRQKFAIRFLVLGQIAATILTLYSPLLGDEKSRFGTYTLRRNYFVPAHINYLHYDFFSKNEKSRWAHSKITLGLVDKAYKYPTARIVGQAYTNVDFSKRRDQFTNANTGWLGVGYAHLGVTGVLLYAFIVGLMIRFTHIVYRKTNLAFTGSALFLPYFSMFASTDVPVAFLSHGLFLLIILTVLLKSVDSAARDPYKT